MSLVRLETHAELERRRRYSDPTDCRGRMRVVDQDSVLVVLECDQCGFEAGLPAREADPSLCGARLVESRRDRSGIPAALRGLALPDDGSRASRAIRGWATGSAERHGLTLTGGVGVGKTFAAAAAAWERVKVEPLRWVSVPALSADLGRAFSDEARHEALSVLVGSDALVLDDIDKVRPSEFTIEVLFTAIDSRMTADAGLLVTTNLPLSELADRYGDAVVSRLAGYGETFLLEGRDRRLERFAAA
jgi:hypothetical protein